MGLIIQATWPPVRQLNVLARGRTRFHNVDLLWYCYVFPNYFYFKRFLSTDFFIINMNLFSFVNQIVIEWSTFLYCSLLRRDLHFLSRNSFNSFWLFNHFNFTHTNTLTPSSCSLSLSHTHRYAHTHIYTTQITLLADIALFFIKLVNTKSLFRE